MACSSPELCGVYSWCRKSVAHETQMNGLHHVFGVAYPPILRLPRYCPFKLIGPYENISSYPQNNQTPNVLDRMWAMPSIREIKPEGRMSEAGHTFVDLRGEVPHLGGLGAATAILQTHYHLVARS